VTAPVDSTVTAVVSPTPVLVDTPAGNTVTAIFNFLSTMNTGSRPIYGVQSALQLENGSFLKPQSALQLENGSILEPQSALQIKNGTILKPLDEAEDETRTN
jgi:hypothetical protein